MITMWSTVVFIAIFVCSHADPIETERYNITVQDPVVGPVTNRIIGGSQTTIQQYPFLVQLRVNNQLQCGGSLLTLRHVLSAAHCFFDQRNNPLRLSVFRIRAGSTNLSSGGTTVRISRYVVHERYNPITFDNDIAVVVLSSRLRQSASVNFVAIPRQGYVVSDNATVVHAGWGRTNENIQVPSEVLRHVAVYVVNHTLCATRYREIQVLQGVPATITQNMICAGVIDVGGRDACQGDSGGPLLFNNELVGVISWGAGCAQARYPGVNARVSSYTNWINATVTRYNSGSRLDYLNSLTLATIGTFLVVSSNYFMLKDVL
ncbi:achelase-1-like [Plodia interpunctella]|uniref:achelase-1-like n=1 Tax=Plodia interpunctella TaxID=58824 RepID=UPI002367A138|nr:achelase-1-like [Plodia interpunctella]